MNFVVSSTSLLKQLQLVNGVIGSSVVMPILEDFLFEITDGVLALSATDLETSIVTTMPIDSTENGTIAIPSRPLIETLKILPEQPLSFKIDLRSYTIEITTSNGKYKLNGESGEDFPRIPKTDSQDNITMPCAILQRSINSCYFALSNEAMRPAMTGMLFNATPTNLNMVSTDAHRLVKITRNDIKTDKEYKVILPKKALNILKSLLTQDGNAELRFDNNNLFLTFGEVNMVCRLIDASYPNYNAVIPTDNNNLILINRSDLLTAIKRIFIYTNKTSAQVVFKLSGSDLHLSGQDLDSSQEANEQMTCEYGGEDLSIGFNGKFLIEILNTLNTENVRFEISNPTRAILIKPDENEIDEDITMLIMPIMVQESN
jgi:DNA polymerase-3 subunit beta